MGGTEEQGEVSWEKPDVVEKANIIQKVGLRKKRLNPYLTRDWEEY
ncbi:hypothetical protein [Bacillus sp. PS06]|nr:hypothetical protein [Bacillus sp. PS06]MBD8069791.1 hypothetical protein [Bacillus sp. PS06]